MGIGGSCGGSDNDGDGYRESGGHGYVGTNGLL